MTVKRGDVVLNVISNRHLTMQLRGEEGNTPLANIVMSNNVFHVTAYDPITKEGAVALALEMLADEVLSLPKYSALGTYLEVDGARVTLKTLGTGTAIAQGTYRVNERTGDKQLYAIYPVVEGFHSAQAVKLVVHHAKQIGLIDD